MNPSFQKLFTRIESQREEMLNSVRGLTEEQFNRSSAPGKWSVAEILSHIIAAERMSLQYIQKKIQGISESKDSGWKEEMKMILLKLSQRIPGIKFKAPRKVVENTTPYHNLATITTEWDHIRNEFKLFLEKIPDQYVNRMIYKHARVGYLNMKHGLMFFPRTYLSSHSSDKKTGKPEVNSLSL
ncbi:MAG: DinB family protein [Bacteroidota bacterium]